MVPLFSGVETVHSSYLFIGLTLTDMGGRRYSCLASLSHSKTVRATVPFIGRAITIPNREFLVGPR